MVKTGKHYQWQTPFKKSELNELTRRCGDSYDLNQIKFKMHVYVFVVLAV